MSQARRAASITLVVPFYNEEANVRAFHQQVTAALAQLGRPYDVICVDDGSRDTTLSLLNALADDDSHLTILAFSRNFGHQAALTAGLDIAAGEVVIVMDSDLQHPVNVLPRLLAEYERGYDIVYAARNEAQNLSAMKRLTSEIYYWLFERMANVTTIRNAADFRLMSQPAVAALRQLPEVHRYLRGLTAWVGFSHTVIHYDQPDRAGGQPGYTWRKSLRLARDGIFSFSTVPLNIITWLGLMLTLLSALYLLYIFITFVMGITVVGWASTTGVVLLMGGVQLLSLGTIAQYIAMIVEQVKDRPIYILKQKRLAPTPTIAPQPEPAHPV